MIANDDVDNHDSADNHSKNHRSVSRRNISGMCPHPIRTDDGYFTLKCCLWLVNKLKNIPE